MDIPYVNQFCIDSAPIWQFVGYIVLIFKIVIPIILIVLGIVDLGKAIIASDDKAISKSTQTLVKRVAAGIIIFFIPTLIDFIFSIVAGFSKEIKANYYVCKECLINPTKEGTCGICAKDPESLGCQVWVTDIQSEYDK